MDKVASKLLQVKWVAVVVVFWVTLGVYLKTLTPTVPFWDSGEFIATSHILGIPHPPGTPLYVLIGRLFSLIPVATVALKINFLSSLMSATAVCLMFLVTWRLLVRCLGHAPNQIEKLFIMAGAMTAAFFIAFSDSFWDNAIEAEVYSAASLVQALCVFLALRWAEGREKGKNDNLLLAIVYILALGGMGIHLGGVLVAPGLVVFALLVNKRSVLSPRFIGLAALAIVLGTSVTFFLYIRAHLEPAINEADPRTLKALWEQLNREQYGQGSVFYILTHRKTSWAFQFNEMFFRYTKGEYELFPEHSPLHGLGVALPLLAALAGMVWHAGREAKTWWMQFVIVVTTSIGLVVYLNFSDHEVRERDYFFTFFYQFFAVWMGMAVAAALLAINRLVGAKNSVAASGASAAILPLVLALALPLSGFLPVRTYWRTHDRSEFWIAHDYAYNMLSTLPKDAILFTNGDNDTFPLWYLQYVEGYRADVRVANLSLLQTNWYNVQLKTTEPKVPYTMSEAQIADLQPYYNSQGKVVWVKDLAIADIVKANGWKRPLYVAVTVPRSEFGYGDQMVLEGLNYRMTPEKGPEGRVDLEKTMYALDHTFKWRGVLNPDGSPDTTVYKDDNARRLSENYAAAFVQSAFEYRVRGDFASAMKLMTRAEAISPEYPGVIGYPGILLEEAGRTAEAEAHYTRMMQLHPDNGLVYQRYGYMLTKLVREGEGEKVWKRGIEAAPDYRALYQSYGAWLFEKGRNAEAMSVVARYVERHPDDQEWATMLESYRAMLDKPTPGGATTAPPSLPGGTAGSVGQ